MDSALLLRRMDLNMQEMYREMARWTPGGFVVERRGLVMVGAPHGTVVTNMAIVAGRTDVDTIVRETELVYGRGGLPFSVHTRAHVDVELEAALAASGFSEITATPGMVLRAAAARAVATPTGLQIRPVLTDDDRAAYGEVMAEAFAVYGSPEASTIAFFARMEAVSGPTTQAFLGLVGSDAVAGATLYVSHDIGGIGWVGTRPRAFGHGYGAAVTWRVVAEGLERGVPALSLQASPMGAPVYRRMGFETPTHYRMYVRFA